MKILYAIQGTGNGHITRAMEIIPHLKNYGEVDLLVSGHHCEIILPWPVRYRLQGLGFSFGKNGGIDYFRTYLKNNIKRFRKEIKLLPVNDYDLVISDFEPVSSWACYQNQKHCIALSNQCAILHPGYPSPKKIDPFGKFILKNYAPSSKQYGFNFLSIDTNIFTPVIRSQVRKIKVSNEGHYTVYLPAYENNKIKKRLGKFKNVQWQVFSKHNSNSYTEDNFSFSPINEKLFLKSMAGATGVICNAGFGTTSEALFLGKKLLVIPMKSQYEQQCNAEIMKRMGVTVVKNLKKKHRSKIAEWIESDDFIKIDYRDQTGAIVKRIIDDNQQETNPSYDYLSENLLEI